MTSSYSVTRAALLDVVYRFYPRNLPPAAPGYDATEEAQRRRDAAQCGAAAYPSWEAMVGRLSARYAIVDDAGSPRSGFWDPAYSASVVIPGRKLGFHLSLLGPFYGIHCTGLPIEAPAVIDLTREIEASYPGYASIPRELGDEVVPDVSPFLGTDFGEGTIHVCLLSDAWRSSSEPWPLPQRSFAEQIADLTDGEREALAGLLGPPRRSPSGAVAVARPREPRDDPDREAGEPSDDHEPRRR